MSFILAALAIASGTVTTYFYERNAPFIARLCTGAVLGFTALGFAGFIISSFIGLNALSLTLAGVITSAPLVLLVKRELRERVWADYVSMAEKIMRAIFRPDARTIAVAVFYGLVVTVLWQVFARAGFVRGGEIFTGIDNNLGDLPLHIGIIEGFARGDNFPPQHPEYAGAKLTYPFIADFVAAMFERAGASLTGALFWESFILATALVGLLHRWALKLTRSLLAACLVPLLIFLSGGLSWVRAVRDGLNSSGGLLNFLTHLPHDYAITPDRQFVWGNSIIALLVPQRGFLLGLPLAIIALTLLWQVINDDADERADFATSEAKNKRKGKKRGKAVEKSIYKVDEKIADDISLNVFTLRSLVDDINIRRMIAAGVVVGALPLVHAHSYMVTGGAGFLLALIFARTRRDIIAWALFLGIAACLGAPQILWAVTGSAVKTKSFFTWHFGWDHGTQQVLWFWLKNTGAFIPLLIIALVWLIRSSLVEKLDDEKSQTESRRRLRLALFYLPFALWFIIPNLMTLAPWVWDNIKVLFYWYVASVPIVAWLLARFWNAKNYKFLLRAIMVVLLFTLTAAGSLDVWRAFSETTEQRIYDGDAIKFAELIDRTTPPRALLLCAPTYNSIAELSGRRELSGYAGHLWSHGIDYTAREADLFAIYAGAPNADDLLKRYGVEYVIVSPVEVQTLGAERRTVNQGFFERYEKVGQVGEYKLYKVARQ